MSPLFEVGEESGALALEADFCRSAVATALACHCTEYLNKGDIFGSAHYVGYAVFCNIGILSCLIGCEVGSYIRTFAYCRACALDLIMQDVRAFVVRYVVGFLAFTRQGVGEKLLAGLTAVGVVRYKIGFHYDGFHFSNSFLSARVRSPYADVLLYHIFRHLSIEK